MRVGILATGIATCLALVLAAAWLTRSDTTSPSRPRPESVGPAPIVPSPSGPWPRAVFEKTEFDFGNREAGDEASLEFEVRNAGEAPLRMQADLSTCRCTLTHLDPQQIEPGATARVTLTWLPSNYSEPIEKIVEIKTNDPQQRTIGLRILGQGVQPLLLYPRGPWELRELTEIQPTMFEGSITSPLSQNFSLTSIESSDPTISIEAEPISDAAQLSTFNAASGYRLRVAAKPVGPVGYFVVPVKIRTDVTSRATGRPAEVEAVVTGMRRGPFHIRGREWAEEEFSIGLGQFDSKIGKTATLSLLARDEPAEGLQFTEIACDPSFLKVTLSPDEKSQRTPRRYWLTVEYPPGLPRGSRGAGDPGFIRIKSNHPAAADVTIQIFFSTY